MIQKVNSKFLKEISAHTRKLGVKRFFQSMGYERCGELPLMASRLEPLFLNKLRYLDIGSGDSVLPTYILKKTNWDVTCVDKFSWVQKQNNFASKVMPSKNYVGRFHVLEQDFLNTELEQESFDIITNVSVIEHFDNNLDVVAMKKSAKLLRPGGKYILTTLMNDNFFKEFHLNQKVYGEEFKSEPVFFQRHYDVASLEKRVIEPTGLTEKERLYFGDYGIQFFERFMDIAWPWKPVKVLYQWATPFFAKRFISYRDYPISRPEMHMHTASGVFVVMEKA